MCPAVKVLTEKQLSEGLEQCGFKPKMVKEPNYVPVLRGWLSSERDSRFPISMLKAGGIRNVYFRTRNDGIYQVQAYFNLAVPDGKLEGALIIFSGRSAPFRVPLKSAAIRKGEIRIGRKFSLTDGTKMLRTDTVREIVVVNPKVLSFAWHLSRLSPIIRREMESQ